MLLTQEAEQEQPFQLPVEALSQCVSIVLRIRQLDRPVVHLTITERIHAAIPGDAKASFLPETRGNHGSRALWARFEDSPAYWEAVTSFLDASNVYGSTEDIAGSLRGAIRQPSAALRSQGAGRLAQNKRWNDFVLPTIDDLGK